MPAFLHSSKRPPATAAAVSRSVIRSLDTDHRASLHRSVRLEDELQVLRQSYAGDRRRLDELEHREAVHAEQVRDWQALIDKAVVRQLRHHFGLFLAHFSDLCYPTHAVQYALLSVRAHSMLIGACDPMLCPISAFRSRRS